MRILVMWRETREANDFSFIVHSVIYLDAELNA